MLVNIKQEMSKLSDLLNYEFNDINNLSNAMNSTKIQVPRKSKKKKEYFNQGLATVGDAILKALIAVDLYKNGFKTKGQITKCKEELENNKIFHEIVMKEGIINYAYNNKHFYSINNPAHEKVFSGKHDTYLEAIVGAIYYDGDFNQTKKWFDKWLKPLLEKYRKIIKENISE